MQPQPAIFEEHEIRRVYDEGTETRKSIGKSIGSDSIDPRRV